MSTTPHTPASLRDQARSLTTARQFEEAITLLRQALAIRPDDAETLNDLGNNLLSARHADQAVAIFRQAIRLSPGEARLLSNLGLALAALGQVEDAEVAFLEALHLNPVLASAHNNLGLLYFSMARHEAAIECIDYALLLQPNYPSAKRNRALANLALGNFAAGWRDYDHLAFGLEPPAAVAPAFNGESLAGKRILLTGYQGIGDTLHFIRYAPQLKAERVLLHCPAPLVELLADFPGIDQVVAQEDAPPVVDFTIAVAALPRVFNTTLATIPAPSPYVSATPDRIEKWRGRLAGRLDSRKKTVGIVWQGNPNHQWDHFRSLPLSLFEPLAQLPGVQLLSLQTGPGTEQIAPFQRITNDALIVPETHPHNLADTAGLISLCDLMISVDSAPAHLAGALGKPTWIPLSVAADWRWFTGRDDSPWYPTVRLFRQRKINDWPDVFARITDHLRIRSISEGA